MDWDHPNSPPFVLLSIPSHCTITANGQTGIIPRHPIGYTLSLLSIVLSPCAHSAGCLLYSLFITIRCYHNKSIYYRCENRLVVLTTKWLHGLFQHSESHSHTSILVRFGFAFQEIACSKLAIHFFRSPLCPHPLLC